MPLHETLLDMVIKFIPNPREAQRYRIPKIWKGDVNTEIGKAMLEADPNGPLVFFINDVRGGLPDRRWEEGEAAAGKHLHGALQGGYEGDTRW